MSRPRTPVQIRRATRDDDAAVAELFTAYAQEFAHELGKQDVAREGQRARLKYSDGALLVADDDGTIVGCVAYEPWGPGRARMKRMYVPTEHRRKGIGRQLAIAIMERAERDGNIEMVLDTSMPMEAATKLYTDLGFAEHKPNYTAPCNDVVYLRKAL